ncbi:MAG TPA: hypothetical protein VG672_18540 [Bryobacteraceae bacterium]|jgi:hypothetical protein|nr:hypothetical protein [Bryobacteraceae bacterium]
MDIFGFSGALGALAGLIMALITFPVAFWLARLCLAGLIRVMGKTDGQ